LVKYLYHSPGISSPSDMLKLLCSYDSMKNYHKVAQ
jgi:hypothetical protein